MLAHGYEEESGRSRLLSSWELQRPNEGSHKLIAVEEVQVIVSHYPRQPSSEEELISVMSLSRYQNIAKF